MKPLRPAIAAHPEDASAVAAELRARVGQVARGASRAAVLGVSDGLVTNLCLILGLTGANAVASAVELAALASLLAGAFSMAAGEWISVRSQVELFESLIGGLRRLIERNPKAILDELTGSLEQAGFGRATAQVATTELPLDEPRFLRFCSMNLFGIDPDSLGSPLAAATSSFGLFAVGAFVPLAPWLFTGGAEAVVLSICVAGAASLVVGGYVARSTTRSVPFGAARQLAIVAAASAVTYGIGHLFGTVVG